MHDDFRIWITSMPNEKISVNILQLSKKITKEAPPGIKVNMKRAYRDII
jgi:dynein heavy chain